MAWCITTNEDYQLGVEEIIWDDATVVPSGGDGDDYFDESDEEVPAELAADVQQGRFAWFARGCKSSVKAAKDRMADRPVLTA
ncbi:hypothetical protein FVEG_13340 [Fusarium verticillioides 7600]|uniref:Uncharacterized protein n=1 Tax=Gibberella moniliformis (strain M3125 / FGSC 7600) TaxID=334819 RepID=W7N6K0_GIBM7|nr:hypothetical protein FVEG_13340 [Fusarium verticillioides 7600]EWG55324.1 hypothetical protein FVEG_13340 [Fusarium verticillioides 7600]